MCRMLLVALAVMTVLLLAVVRNQPDSCRVVLHLDGRWTAIDEPARSMQSLGFEPGCRLVYQP